ncbi:MAG TPA: hypothetical protein PJ983_11305, partial [Flavobacteriales bacterium]|nr:hypothetical protein [Flavobacteriales bacterium]
DEIWMDTTSYPARSNTLAAILFAGFTTDGNMYEPSSQNLEFKADLLAVVAQFSDPADPNVLVQEAADLLFALPISAAVRDQLKSSFLLFGQTNDLYWTYAYTTYVADPQTTDMAAQLVPVMLQALFNDMRGAAEIQLF